MLKLQMYTNLQYFSLVIMILSKLKPVFSKLNFQKSIPNLKTLFPKPFSKAEKIYDSIDDVRYYALQYIRAFLAPSIIFIPKRTFYDGH